MTRIASSAILALLVALAACVHVYPPGYEATPPGPSVAEQPAGAPAEAKDDDDPFKPWDEALKDTRAVEGFVNVHQHRDNRVFLEILPDRLDQDFGMVLHIARGAGDLGIVAGLPVGPSAFDVALVRFRRIGDQVQLVHRNQRFTAEPDSPMRESAAINVGHSILATFKIESQHKETEALLVDATDFFVSDYPGLASWMAFFFGARPVSFERGSSHVSRVLGFPRNVEIDAELTFRGAEAPGWPVYTVSDPRSMPITVRYSLIALPEEPMRPRLADQRVGHFITAVYDFSLDQEPSQFRRYVRRWRLEKANPGAAVSEPVQPIVFYVDHSVPHEYRRYVKEGVEAWNKAFEAAGFRNAIVARDAPDDPEWSAEDVRHSTVRWSAAYGMGYAIGPSQADPRTGEILNSDVLISSSFLQYWRGVWDRLAAPDDVARELRRAHRLHRELPGELAQHLCLLQLGKSHQLGFQYAALAGLGLIEPGQPMPEEYLGAAIRDLVMHEVGHSLGLRHNFKGSSAIPYDRLHDRDFTRQHGLTLSVMDYAPVNVALDPSRQGYFWNPEVGSYDVWAVQYAYAPVGEQPAEALFGYAGAAAGSPEAELPALRRIAQRASDPLLAYGTDEDNWLGPFAVDPLTNAWDLGSDPLRHAGDRARLVNRIRPRLEQRLIAPGESYARLRGAYTSLLLEQFNTLLPVTKKVGGLYTARDHRGDPGERPPFEPVPAERQREAVRLIVDQAFAPGAYSPDPDALNRLAPSRWAHWGLPWFTAPLDYPIHDFVGVFQAWLLEDLLDPARLARMVDNEVRMPAGREPYRVSELFEMLTTAIWAELGPDGRQPARIDSFRRNLQRVHLDELTRLLLRAGAGPFVSRPAPEDARSLARWELMRLSESMGTALRAGARLDTPTRAHLAESKARIDRALDASIALPAPR